MKAGGWIAVILVLALAGSGELAAAQGQAVTEVAELKVSVGEAPLPKVTRRVPNLSPEQMASTICVDRINRSGDTFLAQVAYDATVEAKRVRIAAFNGLATEQDMIRAERNRQNALDPLGPYTQASSVARAVRNASIGAVSLERGKELATDVLHVKFTVRNGAARFELPPVTLLAADQDDFILAGQTTQLEDVFLAPGEGKTYTLKFHNPPTYTHHVRVVFAPPFINRGFRGCAFLNPLATEASSGGGLQQIFQPSALLTTQPAPEPGVPNYTLAELAVMELWARNDSRGAFGQQDSPCDPPGQRRWRDLMVKADAISDAWVKSTAAAEIRRDAAKGIFLAEDVAAADQARAEALRAVAAIRPASAAAKYAGMSLREIEALPQGPSAFRVTALVRNDQFDVRPMPPIRIVALDRYGFPLTEVLPATKAPLLGRRGGTLKISYRLSVPADLVAQVEVMFAC